MHYGHELQFGTFITPTNDPPQAAVRLAELSEASGYDLVTFQDHPYQPRFHDTSTLMSWVAARTERDPPLGQRRQPAAAPARGARARRRQPRPALRRPLRARARRRRLLGCDRGDGRPPAHARPGRRRPLRGDRRHPRRLGPGRARTVRGRRRVLPRSGAKRGPAPAHNIPIWIGALKPRMLRLIGRKADGWLPSLAYMKPGDFAAGNRIIDEAALAAGRDPREIRRLVNIGGRFSAGGGGFLDGPAEQWVEQLLPSSSTTASARSSSRATTPHDAALRRRGRAGAARGGRARARGTRMPRPSPRPPGSVAAPRCARSAATASTTTRCPGARRARDRAGRRRVRAREVHLHARRVARPRAAARATRTRSPRRSPFARENPAVPLGVRSGGHGISGRSTNDGGIVIDLCRLDAMRGARRVERRLVRIGAGRALEGRRGVPRAARMGAELGRLRRRRRRRPRDRGRHRLARARARAHDRPRARRRGGARRRPHRASGCHDGIPTSSGPFAARARTSAS